MLRNKKIWALVLLLCAVLLYPFESTVVPSQNVLVVSEGWHPIADILVRQSWKHYSLEARGHEEDKLMMGDQASTSNNPRLIQFALKLNYWRNQFSQSSAAR